MGIQLFKVAECPFIHKLRKFLSFSSKVLCIFLRRCIIKVLLGGYMTIPKLDSFKQAIEVLCGVLKVNRTMLAGLVGVTEKSLQDWEGRGIGDATPKSKRLELLYKVAMFIEKNHPNLNYNYYRRVLENSVIVFDVDSEDGYTTIMNLIIDTPEETYWQPLVQAAVKDYLSETNFITKEQRLAN